MGGRLDNVAYCADDVVDTRIAPYSSRIRANVWLGSNGGTGLKILNGNLGYV